jgi:hypothetical protein
VLRARHRSALGAWLDYRFHRPLQTTRLFEAPVPSLFHNDS